jgi:methyl-accepting chemotaxis protein
VAVGGKTGLSAASAKAGEHYNEAMTGIVAVSVIAALLTVLLAWLLTRSIVTPLNKAITAAVEEVVRNAVSTSQASNQSTQAAREGRARGLIARRNRPSASEEQAQVSREVDRNLVNIRDLASQSSTGANQTSAASHELSRLAVDLNAMVARFVI